MSVLAEVSAGARVCRATTPHSQVRQAGVISEHVTLTSPVTRRVAMTTGVALPSRCCYATTPLATAHRRVQQAAFTVAPARHKRVCFTTVARPSSPPVAVTSTPSFSRRNPTSNTSFRSPATAPRSTTTTTSRSGDCRSRRRRDLATMTYNITSLIGANWRTQCDLRRRRSRNELLRAPTT